MASDTGRLLNVKYARVREISHNNTRLQTGFTEMWGIESISCFNASPSHPTAPIIQPAFSFCGANDSSEMGFFFHPPHT